MRLELSEAVSLILALPAHRSENDGHRKMGERAFEILFAYKELCEDNTEKAFNRAMICSVLSAVRAFSVERDRISGEWRALKAIKTRRENLLNVIKNISPFEKGNYWSKTLTILVAFGYSIPIKSSSINTIIPQSVKVFIIVLIVFEVISKITEYLFANLFEKCLPIEKTKKWQEESIIKYKHIVTNFITQTLLLYEKYYPAEEDMYGFKIREQEGVEKLKKYLIDIHFSF